MAIQHRRIVTVLVIGLAFFLLSGLFGISTSTLAAGPPAKPTPTSQPKKLPPSSARPFLSRSQVLNPAIFSNGDPANATQPVFYWPWDSGQSMSWGGGPHGIRLGDGSICKQCNIDPVNGVPIAQRSGLDFGGGQWHPHPMADGTVVYSGPLGPFGFGVIVDHGTDLNGAHWQTLYAHMANDASLHANGPVTRFDTLGTTSDTGCGPSCPPHLHVDLRLCVSCINDGTWNLATSQTWDQKVIDGWTIFADPLNYDGHATRPGFTNSVIAGMAGPGGQFTAGAILSLPSSPGVDGCKANILAANDDGSTATPILLPFTAKFFGTPYGSLYVNNNGNVTFLAPLAIYTPFPLVSANMPIIAPHFSDVDTRGAGSGLVTYGSTTYNGQATFCVNWIDVGYFNGHYDKLNSYQLLLVDRSDRSTGDFDIYMNYNMIQWETGDASGGIGGFGGSPARVGYSNGVSQSFELPGSAISGALVDSNISTGLLFNQRNVSFGNLSRRGRYVFQVTNGNPPTGGTISGTVYANSPNPAYVVPGASVAACDTGGKCTTSSTNVAGQYTLSGLAAGTYTLTVFPSSGSSLLPITSGSFSLALGQVLPGQDVVLTGPQPPPPGTTITQIATGGGGIPIVFWRTPLVLTTHGCQGGTATYQMLQNVTVIQSGSMAEGPPGVFTATVPQLYPNHGDARTTITIQCPIGPTTISFDIYIDPSGVVQTVGGAPLAGATVTLLRSDTSNGPFIQVPSGDGIMSVVNRNNPDMTDVNGRFGWDVIPGYYEVQASRNGCTSPTNPSQNFVQSAILTVPPPTTNLVLTLNCSPIPRVFLPIVSR